MELHAAASCLVDAAIGAAGDVDTAVVMLRTASGKLCQISNSRRATYGYDQRIEAHGAKGLLRAGNVTATTSVNWRTVPGSSPIRRCRSSWNAMPRRIARNSMRS